MGSRLPSAEEVLIIRPTGKKGQALLRSSRSPLVPGALPGSPAFQSRIRTQSGPDGMQLLLSLRNTFPGKAISQKIQGAILMKKILLTVVLGVAVVAGAQSAAQPAPGTTGHAAAEHEPATGSEPAAGSVRPRRRGAAQAAPVIKDPAEYNAYVSAVQRERSQRKDQRAGSVPHPVSQQRHEESGAGNSDGHLPAGRQPEEDDGDGHEAGDGGRVQRARRWRCWPTLTG